MKNSKLLTGIITFTLISGVITSNTFADGGVVGGTDAPSTVVSGETGGTAPQYKSETSKKQESTSNKQATSDLGTRKVEVVQKPKEEVSKPIQFENNSNKKYEGSTVFEKSDSLKKQDTTKPSIKVNNKKEESKLTSKNTQKKTDTSKKEVNKKTKSKIQSKPKKKYNTSGEDGKNMTIKDLVDDPSDINQQNQTNKTSNSVNDAPEIPDVKDTGNQDESLDQESSSENKPYISDFIRPLGLEVETRRLNETREKIYQKCEETDSYLMNKIYFTIYMDRVVNDVTHYDSLSPIILNKRTGNKSQYITRGEFALLINNILESIGNVNNADNLPLIDTKDTIFEIPVANITSLNLMDTNSLMSFDTYNLVTWGEFKETFKKLDRLLYLRENKELSWNYDNQFRERYKGVYDYQIDPDTFISKTMLVGLMTDLLSEYQQ